MNLSRFLSKKCYQIFIADALFARVQIARPARSHRNSSLFPRLKKSQPGYPDGEEDERARPSGRIPYDQHESQPDADRQTHDAHQSSFAPLARSNINRLR